MNDREFTDITDEVDGLLADPGVGPSIAEARAAMDDADRRYAIGLAAVRRAFDLTQSDLAARLGVSQPNVAKIERREDLLVSTLRSYLEAIGGRVTIVVTFADRDAVEIELGDLGRQAS